MLSVFSFKKFEMVLSLFSTTIFMLILVISYFRFSYPICFSELVLTYSKVYNLKPQLVYAVINTESKFNYGAVSSRGAVGLMQIMPSTGEYIFGILNDSEEFNLLDPETNIKYGCFYLNYLFNKYNSLNEVLYAYNAGEGNLKEELKTNPELNINKIQIKETKQYIKKVLKAQRYYNCIM